MENYVVIKDSSLHIKAEPNTRETINYEGKKVVEEGYNVEYTVSNWLPKKLFENTYEKEEDSQDAGILAEEEELNKRLIKLEKFISKAERTNMSLYPKALLLAQFKLMHTYQDILNLRYYDSENIESTYGSLTLDVAMCLVMEGLYMKRFSWEDQTYLMRWKNSIYVHKGNSDSLEIWNPTMEDIFATDWELCTK